MNSENIATRFIQRSTLKEGTSIVLQIGDKIVQNEKKFMKICTVLGLYILKTSGLGTISVSVPKSNMAAKFKMAAFYTETSQF